MASQSYTVPQRRRESPIIDRRVEKSNVNRLKREITALRGENQNLRQELIELQWRIYQQKLKILTALGEPAETSEFSGGFF
jgi:hypothetical protein